MMHTDFMFYVGIEHYYYIMHFETRFKNYGKEISNDL